MNLITKVVLEKDGENNEGGNNKFNKEIILFGSGVIFKKLYNLIKFIRIML